MRHVTPVAILMVFGLAADTTLLCAYVDPGTGSYVFQILIAGIVAASMGIRIFWNRLKSVFSGRAGADRTRLDDPND